MPELPEVEVTRRSFADRIAGARIIDLQLGKPLRWPLGVERERLIGQVVQSVGRRGKYLLVELGEGCLLLHLGMSGSLQFAAELPPRGTHDHFELVTTRGRLRLHDPRRFGAVVFAATLDDPVAQKLLGGLGVEPLEAGFDPVSFHQRLKQRRASIKQVLLAGDIVVGVGNIYASEALYLAGIRPTRRADQLSKPAARRLHQAVVTVLQRALALGGSTLRDFSSAEGQSGYFQLDAMVYGRSGQPCRVCGTRVKTLRQGQRSSFFCPVCQKP
ncbi:bifunctional DNA-formamidopyrimidine glycosylase/DNA-(apurinic or apyrimidinic site) lyase [Hydrogenophaga sp.]|uniref:bifunctional DNA-formamidopyrimidine glycosylase/DNA-(apurinic or apyrimidinic site) lyase n=1 Tax=Hydrogenophaga sp. TaxID=1904254 RepID=UPI00262F75D3|nr:bifunctional DNA-formamidopyrimidine glycosylase/DNA-(apurinic or apyrimidinic site) lyase [Hydrogenophaga sp.]MDM7948316.1 bifunctional DNA-formamidopyrimidine glycosylase/DNA-(apurinic or apyrimidinic site) lyase [Hydrogenophaga sp.]